MLLCICCHLLTPILDGLNILSSVCHNGPSQGWWQGISSSHISFSVYIAVDIFPLVFIFTMCVIQHLGLLKKFFRDPFCFWGFPFHCILSDVFRWGSEVVGKLDDNSRSIWIECSILYFWRYLIFSPGFYVHPVALFWQRSCGTILIPWLRYESGSGVFGGTTSQLWEMSQEVFSLPSVLVVQWKIIYQWSVLTFLWQYFFR